MSCWKNTGNCTIEPAMRFANRVNQTLHDEHSETTALVQRLQQVIARHRRSLPSADDPAIAQLFSDLSSVAVAEVERHFAFEEQALFPYLDAMGEQAIGAHLTEEHDVLLPLLEANMDAPTEVRLYQEYAQTA